MRRAGRFPKPSRCAEPWTAFVMLRVLQEY
jgi:hypothetical protein